MKFMFKTTTTMKEYDSKKWWISPDLIQEITVDADDLSGALQLYCEIVSDQFYISISKSALKNKQSMYVDSDSGPEQVGYVITGKMLFDGNAGWVYKYIDLWVTVMTIIPTKFEKEIA